MIEIRNDVKAIIFDLDGTLADTMPLHYEACQIVCNKLGFEFPEDYFYAEAGKPTLEVFENLMNLLNLPHNGAAVGQEKEEIFIQLIPKVKPLKLVEDIAVRYKGKLPMAIGSGGQRHTVELTLKAIGYSDFFQSIVSADDVDQYKPHPDTFLKCAEEMNVDPKDCVVLEDGDPGIEAAIAAGMQYIDVRKYLNK